MMDQIVYETTETPEVLIERAHGNLHLRGWDRAEMRIDATVDDAVTFEGSPGQIKISADAGMVIRLPSGSRVKIGQVDGEMLVKNMEGPVSVTRVHGQLLAKSAGPLTAEEVYGNLIAKQIEGGLECQKIHGNAVVRDVEGRVALGEVTGNYVFKGSARGMQVQVRGNANLNLDPEPGEDYHLMARGNLTCRVMPGAGAQVRLKSKSGQMRVITDESSQTLEAKEHEFTLGDGEGTLELEAHGRLDFVSQGRLSEFDDEDFSFEYEEDYSNLAEEITQQVTEQIEAQMETLNEQLNSMFGSLEGLGGKRRDLERKLASKQREIDRKLAEARRSAHRAARRARIDDYRQRRGSRGRPASAPVSDEERMLILKMLEEGKIGVAEADLLLGALEGNPPGSEGLPPMPPMPPLPPLPPIPPEPPLPPEPPEPPAPPEPKAPRSGRGRNRQEDETK